MPEFKNITLTWQQLQKLKAYIITLGSISECPQGELRDKDGNICVEWNDTEVKFLLPE